jgi:hypothetical protein
MTLDDLPFVTPASSISGRGGHAQFYESAIAVPQLEGSTSAIAILQIFK